MDAAIEKLKQQIRKLNDDNLLELQAGSRIKLPYEGDGDLLPTGHLPSFMPKLMERKDRQGKPLLDLELFYT